MAPTLNSGTYTKDLSNAPSIQGGVLFRRKCDFIIPDDTIIYRIVETHYDTSQYDYIAEVYEIGFYSPDFIEQHIDTLREEGMSDNDVVNEIIDLKMEDPHASILVARFAYDDIQILNKNAIRVWAKQIRGAYVDTQKSGVGLAGQIYRQFVLMHGYLVCDNVQTEFGAALWAGTIRDVVGRVDIYDCHNDKYIQELGDKGIGVGGFVPWDLNCTSNHTFRLARWILYPFEITSCTHIVLVVSL